MRDITKKILSIILAAALAVSSVPVYAGELVPEIGSAEIQTVEDPSVEEAAEPTTDTPTVEAAQQNVSPTEAAQQNVSPTEAEARVAAQEGLEAAAPTTEWVKNQDGTFSYKVNSVLVTGWRVIDGYYRYFGTDHKMVVSKLMVIDGYYRYLNEWGCMLVSQTITYQNNKIKLNASGCCVNANYWIKLDNRFHYLNKYFQNTVGWAFLDGYYRHFNSDGVMETGWKKLEGYDRYFNEWGCMLTGSQTINGEKCYLNEWGCLLSGKIVQDKESNTNANTDAEQHKPGWETANGKTYYYGNNGKVTVGFLKLDNIYYYFDSQGVMQTGWHQIDGYYRWFNEKGVMQVGWLKIDGYYRYFNEWGCMLTGLQVIDGYIRYLNEWGCMMTGIQTIGSASYFFNESGCMLTGWQKVGDYTYYFYPDSGKMAKSTQIGDSFVDRLGHKKNPIQPQGGGVSVNAGKTIKGFLQTALQPCGQTLYIWGGGHDSADALRKGLNPQWKNYYMTWDSSYNYDQHRWEYGNGLDCSGYVGWVVNQFGSGYTGNETSSGMARLFAVTKGWGTYDTQPQVYRPGDIVSLSGHIFIVLGSCADGSLVIIHSSPQGVQISGTCTPSGNYSSEAISLAKQYMTKYFSGFYWSNKNCGVGYFGGTRCRFNVNGSGLLTDPQGYQNKTAAQVLKDLFGA